MSTRPKICQIVPTTLNGISSGSAIRTRQSEDQNPRFGMLSAMKMPSGTSIARMIPVKSTCRPSAARTRSEESTSSYHSRPAQKKTLFPNVSCTE